MASIGQTIKLGSGVWTGSAPGQRQWDVSNQQAKVKGLRTIGGKQYVDLDFTPWGGGTGWAEYGSVFGGGGGGGGGSSSSSGGGGFADIIRQQQQQQESLLKRQQQERARQEAEARAREQAFLGRYTDTINSQESLSAMNARIAQELGLDQMRDVTSQMSSTIRNLPQQIQDETRGAFVNASQLEGRQRQEMNKLTPAYQDALAAQGETEARLAEQLQLGAADQQRQLRPLELEGQILSDQIARETTGFNIDRQNELDALMSRLANQQQLTMAEWQRANQLADMETQFQQQKELVAYQQSFKKPEPQSTALSTLANLISGSSSGSSSASTLYGYTKEELDKMPHQKRMTILWHAAGNP